MTTTERPHFYTGRFVTNNQAGTLARGYGEIDLRAMNDDRGGYFLACRILETSINLGNVGRKVTDAEVRLDDGWHDLVEGRVASEAREQPRLRLADTDVVH